MGELFETLHDYLQQGRPLVLARIVRASGSVPRKAGAACIVHEDGAIEGSIGGGLLEHRVRERAELVFRTGACTLYRFELEGSDLLESGMICGGEADVYLEPLFPEHASVRAIFARAAEAVRTGEGASLLTCLAEGAFAGDDRNRALVQSDGNIVGRLPQGCDPMQLAGSGGPGQVVDGACGWSVFVEPVKPLERLLLFGAGHVGVHLARMAARVGFRIAVADDRHDFASRERFPDADNVLVQPFDRPDPQLVVDSGTFVAIMTRGHLWDYEVLRWALTTEAAYIGMIGSRRKRDVVFGELRKEGFAESDLARVHSPIGLDIGASTPEEIALSVAAELVQVRAGLRRAERSSVRENPVAHRRG